jgi:hypothetical protein
MTLTVILGVKPAGALEELQVYRGVLVLEGKIVPGDYDKLRNFLGKKSNFDKISDGVFLASPGGYVVESLKIGHLIRSLRLSTDAPSGPPQPNIAKFGESIIKANDLVDPKSNYLCASACFFVYVSGIYRKLNWAGRLGIHRPVRLEGSSGEASLEWAINATWRLRDAVKDYLQEMGVPSKYIDLVYSVPPGEMKWITQGEYDSDLQGFVPGIRDLVDEKCDRLKSRTETASANVEENLPAPSSAKISDAKKLAVISPDCWMRIKADLQTAAWRKVFPGN